MTGRRVQRGMRQEGNTLGESLWGLIGVLLKKCILSKSIRCGVMTFRELLTCYTWEQFYECHGYSYAESRDGSGAGYVHDRSYAATKG